MTTHFGLISLLPALVTILVAVVSQRVVLAIFLGIVAGSLGGVHGDTNLAWGKVEYYVGVSFQDLERLKIAAFVILMGALVEVIARSGAYLRLSEAFRSFLNTPRKGRLASIGLGGVVFFDDYANLLISGTSMRGLGAALRISPGLHGYLVDQMATVVSMMFISTWAAYEGSLMMAAAETVGLKGTPTQLLVDSLPYHVFTILGFGLAVIVAWEGRWFGARFDTEPDKAVRPVNVVGMGAKLWHGLLPLLTLVLVTVYGVYSSAMTAQAKLGAAANWINLLAEVPTIDILLMATLAGHLVAYFSLISSAVLMPFQYRKAVFDGCRHMLSAGLVIILAKGLSVVAGDLGTGTYITEVLRGLAVPAIVPALIFVVSFLISVATGFAWSSMAIVMPVAYQMAMNFGGVSMIPIVSGAVVSGSIAGGMIVPYSDTTVMASAAFSIPPVYHAKTQMPQILVASGVAVFGYIMLAVQLPTGFTYGSCFIALYALHSIWAGESRLISADVALETPQAKKCPRCWGEMTPDAQFCGLCGKPLPGAAPEDLGWFSYTEGNEKAWYAALVVIVLFSLSQYQAPCKGCGGTHSPIMMPFRGATCAARVKQCYANQRVLMGAIEMYNMDHPVMKDSLSDMDAAAGSLLIKSGYLKTPLTRPTPGCVYSGRNLSGKGTISCQMHGSVE